MSRPKWLTRSITLLPTSTFSSPSRTLSVRIMVCKSCGRAEWGRWNHTSEPVGWVCKSDRAHATWSRTTSQKNDRYNKNQDIS